MSVGTGLLALSEATRVGPPPMLRAAEADAHALNAYRRLRTTVLNRMQTLAINSVMVTGATPAVGSSTTALNLALNMARHDDIKVILVELDLRSPSLADTLELNVYQGIEAASRADFRFSEALLPLGDTGVFVVACRLRCENSSERLLSAGMLRLYEHLNALTGRFRVVYDAPPALGCDDVPAIVPHMRSALMVAAEGQSTRGELRKGLDVLDPLPLLGVVLNRSSSRDITRYHY